MDKYHPGYFGKVRIATDTTYRSLGVSRRVVDRGARARRRVGSGPARTAKSFLGLWLWTDAPRGELCAAARRAGSIARASAPANVH